MTARRALLALPSFVLVAGAAVAVAGLSNDGAAGGATPSAFALGFGSNSAGQLGTGTVSSGVATPTPADLPSGVSAVQVATGYSHSVALGSDGAVYAWGANEHGELGDGTTTDASRPTAVSLPAGATVTAVAAGYLDSFAVTDAGAVYAWGYNGLGELGNGSTDDANTPVPVSLPAGVQITAVSAGYAHVLALTTTGAVYAWGYNAAGQLGDGTGTNRLAPVKVALPTGVLAASVSAGYGHSLAATSDGRVFAWGLNNHGQLGTGTLVTSATPKPVDIGTAHATTVSAGYLHSLARLSDGSALAWGDNSYGQLGAGQGADTLPKSTTPVAVTIPGATITDVSAGFGHSLFLTDDGTVFAAGDNSFGELGTGDHVNSAAPVEVALPTGASATAAVTSGYSLSSFVVIGGVTTTVEVTTSAHDVPSGQPVTFTAVVTPTTGAGSVSFTAGADAAPLPGCTDLPLRALDANDEGATCSALLPVGTSDVDATYSGGDEYRPSAGMLAGGGQQVHAVGGALLAWGGNTTGQIGDGSTTTRKSPVAVSLPAGTQVVQVAGNLGHALALLSDGSVYAWGDNTDGELGNGTTTSSKVPVPVELPDGVTAVSVAAGAHTSALVASDGTLYTWGLNNVGQLGDGTGTNHSLPAPAALPDGTVVTAVSVGYAHLLALTSTGEVYGAGLNRTGQLGTGDTVVAATPARVSLPAGVTVSAVSAGYSHSLALTTAGGVLAWGDNSRGELGTDATATSLTPVKVSLAGGATATAVAAGQLDSFATTSTGAVQAWGANSTGQLGNGSTTDADAPTPVTLPTGTTVDSVATGSKSTYARTTSGTVLAWGDNASGELGDATTTAHHTPVAVHLPAGGEAAAIGAGALDVTGYALMPRIAVQATITASPNPSITGKAATFTATISPGDGEGTAAFTADGSPISGCGAVTFTGTGPYTAKCSTSDLAVGHHDVSVEYSGDRLYRPAGADLAGGQQVNLPATTTTVGTSAATGTYGKPVTFTATVSGSDGGGTVAFSSDGTTIAGCGAQPLVLKLGTYKSSCTTSALTGGRHVITALYSGDSHVAPSSGTLSGGELVRVATTLVASPVTVTDPDGLPAYRAVVFASFDGTPVAGVTVTFTLNALAGTSKCSAVTDDHGVATCEGARPKKSSTYAAKFAGTDVYLASSGSSTVTI